MNFLYVQAAQYTKTFSFASDSESWTGNTGPFTTNTYGSGMLISSISGKNKSHVTAGWTLTGITWESLGVPAGATVTSVNGNYDWSVSTYTVGLSSESGDLIITDSSDSNSTVLESSVSFTSTSAMATRNATGNVNVPTALQNSNTSIKINLTGALNSGNNNGAIVTRNYDNIVLVINYNPPADADGNVTAGTVVTEPINISSLVDTVGERVAVMDFNIVDGGTVDGLALGVSQIVLSTSGTGNFNDITWQLQGPDANYVTGTVGSGTITFPSLAISVANAASETYTVYAYISSSTPSSADGATFILSVDGDTNLTVTGGGTTMGATTAVTNGTGSVLQVVATKLIYSTQPPGTASLDTDFTGSVVIRATDANNKIDLDFTEAVTLSAVLDANKIAGTGTLSSTDSGGLVKNAVAGEVSWTDLKYSASETISLKAISTSLTTPIYSTAIAVSGPQVTVASSVNQPPYLALGTTENILGVASISIPAGSASVTSVTIKEDAGTIDATKITNVQLWLSSDAMWDAGDNQIGTNGTFNGVDGEVTFTETFEVGTTVKYLIVRGDIDATATANQTIEIQIKTVDNANGTSGTPLSIGGTSTIWSKRLKLFFDNSGQSENVVDLPVLVKLNSDRITYSDFKTGGTDLRFVDTDNLTVLNYQIEKWNTSGDSIIWVRVPQIDANSTTDHMYVYYGNNSAADGQNSASVWANDFKSVWHFKETSSSYLDSTSNAQNSDFVTVESRTQGKFGDGPLLDGAGNFISVPDANVFDVSDWTISAWIKMKGNGLISTSSNMYPIITKGMNQTEDRATDIQFMTGVHRSTKLAADFENYNGSANNPLPANTTTDGSVINVDEWIHMTAVVDTAGQTFKIYKNGVLDSSRSISDAPNTGNTSKVMIGSSAQASGSLAGTTTRGAFFGHIDEVRFAGAIRSASWVKADFLSGNDTLLSWPTKHTLASSLNQRFRVGDNATAITPLTITAGNVSTITAGNDIRIVIPDTLSMVWDDTDTTATISGSASVKVSTTVSYEGTNKVLVLNVTSDFSVGDSITVSGLSFKSFSGISAAARLELNIAGLGGSIHISDTKTKTISTSDTSITRIAQATSTHIYNSPSNAISVNIQTPTVGNILISSITIDKYSGAITLPPGFTLIKEYTGQSVSGAFAYKIATGDETNVTWNYFEDEEATIWVGEYSGIRTNSPLDVSADANSGETEVASQSTGVTGVTAIPNELAIAIFGIDTIREASGSRTWTNNFSEIASIANPNNGGPGFAIGEKILITTGTQSTTVSFTPTVDQTYGFIATFKGITDLSTALTMSSQANQTFDVDSAPVAISPITITDATPAVITATNDIRIKIPSNLNMKWNVTDTTAVISGTGSGKVSTTVSYEDSGKTLVIDVTTNFSSSDSVTISGLSFANFTAASVADGLDLITAGAGGSVVLTDPRTKTILSNISEILLVATASSTHEYLSPATSITVNIATPTLNNLLVTGITSDKSAGSYTVPSGFTLIDSYVSANVSGALAYKVSNGNETSVTWGNSVSEESSAWVGEYSGIDPTSPLDVSAAANSGTNSVLSQSTGVTAVTAQSHELAIATVGIDSRGGAATSRSWSNNFTEIFFTPPNSNVGTPGLMVAQNILTATGTQTTAVTFSPTADQTYGIIATFKGVMSVVTPVSISSEDNQSFQISDPATAISPITITDSSSASITAANDIRIQIPAGFNMTWDTTDTNAVISGTGSASVSTTVSYENSGKILVLNVTSDLAARDTIIVSGLSFANFTDASSPDNLELIVDGSGGSIVATDTSTIFVASGSMTLSAYTGTTEIASIVIPEPNQYFGSFKLTGAGVLNSITLTEYGTADADSELRNVKLFLDDGDGNWEPAQDTTQLGSTAQFNASSQATFSGLNISAGSTSYFHVILDVTKDIIPLPAPTIGVQVALDSHVSSASSISASSWPISLGTATMETIYPYLQNVSQTGIQVRWKTSSATAGGSVEFGTTDSYGSSVTVSTSTKYHYAYLTGLSANTVYHYKVTSGGRESPDYTFRTAPNTGSTFSFLAYGDNRSNGGTDFHPASASVANAAEVNNPETIFTHVGDYMNGGIGGGDTEWQPQFFLPVRNILATTPIYTTIGNHEYAAADMTDYRSYFDPPVGNTSGSDLYYSFDYGNIHFINLDTQQAVSSGAQWTWFSNDIQSAAAQNAQWRVIVTHKPAYSYGSHGGSADLQTAITNSLALATKGVDLVLAGDNHFYQRAFRAQGTNGGITHLTVGGGGAPLADATTGTYEEASYDADYSYSVINSQNDFMEVTVYNTNNAQVDHFFVPRKPVISSAMNQSFMVGQESTLASNITITDGTLTKIKANTDIRIRIPANVSMTWDTSVTTATITGGASSKVGTSLTYENSNKTVVLNVNSDFAAYDSITVAGMKFNNFTASSTLDNLEMVVDGASGTDVYYDSKTILVKKVVLELVQSASFSHTYEIDTFVGKSITVDFPQPVQEDNLIVALIATDKNSGTYTIPSGFTLIRSHYATSTSGAMAYKVADGGETSISWSYLNDEESSVWIGEYSGIDPISPLDVSAQSVVSESNVTSRETGTTGVTAQENELAIAMVGIDSAQGAASQTWNNSFNAIGYYGLTWTAGLGVASKVLNATGTVSATMSWSPTADQAFGMVATFRVIALSGGSLTAAIVDENGSPVASPAVSLSGVTFSMNEQTSTGYLGTTSQKIRVTNSTSNAPWTLTISPASGPTAVWSSGVYTYDFNDQSATDGADVDLIGGKLTINPQTGELSPAPGCDNTGLTFGSNSAFSEGIVDSITLISAGSSSGVSCYWDMSGVNVTQVIPPQQTPANYNLDLVLTIISI